MLIFCTLKADLSTISLTHQYSFQPLDLGNIVQASSSFMLYHHFFFSFKKCRLYTVGNSQCFLLSVNPHETKTNNDDPVLCVYPEPDRKLLCCPTTIKKHISESHSFSGWNVPSLRWTWRWSLFWVNPTHAFLKTLNSTIKAYWSTGENSPRKMHFFLLLQ